MLSVESLWKCSGLLVLLAIAGGVPAASGAAEAPAATPLELSALTGAEGADLYVHAPPGTAVFEHLHIRIRPPEGSSEAASRIVNLKDVAAPNGIAAIELGQLARAAAVDVEAHVREESPPRTAIHRGEATVKLRPDLSVAAVHAPPQTLTTRAIDVVADLSELNGETGATVTVKLMLGPTPVAEPQTITVPAGGGRSVTFPNVKLTAAMSADLTVVLDGAEPAETDGTNNSRGTTVEVTEHELVRSSVLVPSLGGYGVQFNQHVYAPVTNAPPTTLPDLEAKVTALEPQLVRIFYNDDFEERQPNRVRNLASFYETVQLAHEAGATTNITYQAVNVAKSTPDASMARFAGVLEDLVEVKGYSSVRWVTVANEPNTTNLTQTEYEALFRALHAQLVARGLREHIHLMGGDLVRDGQRSWFQYIAAHMNDILDAYSVHIYWDYWNTPFFTETRLKDVRQIVTEELPAEARKPTYVMEYGVRGIRVFAGKPTLESGYWEDGTELARTNIAAFQQLWFDLAAAQLGFTGSVKWDAYWGKYNGNYNSLYAMIGPASEGWPLFPGYHALGLLLQTTDSGWQVLQVAPWEADDWKLGVPDQQEKEIAAFADHAGQLTLLGLDTHGRDLNTVSPESPEYSIGGLPALTSFNLALWNAAGNGESTPAGTVRSDAAGVARFEVPLHAAFSLTTVPVF